jgi:hypothetical protein
MMVTYRRAETFDMAGAFICYTSSMFLQTLLQLNILILATPALAGWNLMPLAQPGAVHAACVVWQYQAAEATAPKTERAQSEETRNVERSHPIVLSRFAPASVVEPGDQTPTFTAAPAAILHSCHPFSQATRAP